MGCEAYPASHAASGKCASSPALGCVPLVIPARYFVSPYTHSLIHSPSIRYVPYVIGSSRYIRTRSVHRNGVESTQCFRRFTHYMGGVRDSC